MNQKYSLQIFDKTSNGEGYYLIYHMEDLEPLNEILKGNNDPQFQ